MIDDVNGINALGGASHQSSLLACFSATAGPILEIGIGHSSTTILHSLCCPNRRRLVSLESNPEWRDWFRAWNCDGHEILEDSSENVALLSKEKWSVVFVDSWPEEKRIDKIKALLDSTEFLVMHDAGCTLLGILEPILRGRRQFLHKTYNPWTLVVSNGPDIPRIP